MDALTVELNALTTDPLDDGVFDENSGLFRRSRSRTDSALRKQRQKQQEIEKSESKAVLVTNLRDQSHEEFLRYLNKDYGPSAFEEMHIRADSTFGFLVFHEFETMLEAIERFNNCNFNGSLVQLTRCAEATPGFNPFVPEDSVPDETLVLKNLPFEATIEDIFSEMDTVLCDRPVDAFMRLSASGTYSGVVVVRFSNVERALRACHQINGILIRGRQIRAEFKRADRSRSASKGYVPPTPECEQLYDDLRRFKASDELSRLYVTEHLEPATRAQLLPMAAALGLSIGHDPDASTPHHVRILRVASPDSQAPRAAFNRSHILSPPGGRTSRGFDGIRGAQHAASSCASWDSGMPGPAPAEDMRRGTSLPTPHAPSPAVPPAGPLHHSDSGRDYRTGSFGRGVRRPWGIASQLTSTR